MKNRLMKRGESSGRVDDNEETIKKRLQTFHDITKPVIDYYESQGKLKRVDSEKAPDDVFAQVQKILEGRDGEEDSEAAKKKAEEEEAARKKAEEEAKKKADEEAAAAAKKAKEEKEKEEKEKKEAEKKEKEEKEKKEKEEKEKKATEEKEKKAAEEKKKKLKEKMDKERKTKQAEAAKKLKDAQVVFVTGGPGSGKTTQCEKMSSEFGLTPLSSDELVRKEIESGSERGQYLNDLKQKGEQLPNEIVLDVLRDAMLAQAEKSNGFIIDDYPKKLDQGVEFDKNVSLSHLYSNF